MDPRPLRSGLGIERAACIGGKRKQKSTKVEISLTISSTVKPVKETIMNEKKITDTARAGEVVIVRRPHTMPVKVYSYYDIENAFESWIEKGIFIYHKNYSDYVEEIGEENEEVKERLIEAGIGLDSSFVEFSPSPSRDMEIYPWDGNKLKLLSAIIEDDMHAAGVFIAESGETYDDFVERIIEGSRGHKEPSREHIMAELGIDNE